MPRTTPLSRGRALVNVLLLRLLLTSVLCREVRKDVAPLFWTLNVMRRFRVRPHQGGAVVPSFSLGWHRREGINVLRQNRYRRAQFAEKPIGFVQRCRRSRASIRGAIQMLA